MKGDVCFVGDFPTHIGFYDWWGETIISDALEKKGDAIVLLTSPEEAQELYPPRHGFDESSVEGLMERIKEGKAINPPWLEMCINVYDPSAHLYNYSTWVYSHEGRHRIEAAKRMGLSKIPVIIRRKPMYACEGYGIYAKE